ncbi:hypothetical protein J4Q44_G00029080 [Coregonus suidteri]|uniref:Protein S100 n=1 Tax=Coregonus suidteri TaxID=861788 RepID=A0AAN8MHX1_9TELE
MRFGGRVGFENAHFYDGRSGSPSVTDTRAQPTPLEASLGALIMTFHTHAGSGDAKTLIKKELTNLIKAKLPNIAGKGGPEVGDLMTMLDQDTDGSVDFKEYITLIGSLACATVL